MHSGLNSESLKSHWTSGNFRYRDWLHVAINRIRIPEEFAFTIFIAAQHAAPLEGFTKLSTHEDVVSWQQNCSPT